MGITTSGQEVKINFRLLIKQSMKMKRLKRDEWNLMSPERTRGKGTMKVSPLLAPVHMSEPTTTWPTWNSLQTLGGVGVKVPGACKLALWRGGKETIGLYLQGCLSSLQNSLLSRLRSSRLFLRLFHSPAPLFGGELGERANKMMTARDRRGERVKAETVILKVLEEDSVPVHVGSSPLSLRVWHR